MPSGSARVCSTSRVCGWQCWEAKKALLDLFLRQALAEGHGFGGGGGGFIQQRGVGDRQAGEVADQGLEVQQGLQAALEILAGTGCRRCTRPGFPAGCRIGLGVGAVVALTDIGFELLVFARDGLILARASASDRPGREPRTLEPLMLSGMTLSVSASMLA